MTQDSIERFPSESLTKELSRHRFASNTVWSLTGELVPCLLALFAIPFLIERLGLEKFGLLTMIWMVVGYFNLFDLGLGRALTYFVAQRLGSNCAEEIPRFAWTALLVSFALGIISACGLWISAEFLPQLFSDMTPELRKDVTLAFLGLAPAIPFVCTAVAFKGMLQAYQRFREITAVQLPLGIFTFTAPVLVVLLFGPSLQLIAITLAGGRVVAWLGLAWTTFRIVPGISKPQFSKRTLILLLGFGGWISVSNFIAPLLTYLDRLFIGANLGLAEVAYYTTAYDTVTRLSIVPVAIASVVFPAASLALAGKKHELTHIVDRAILLIHFAMSPIAIVFSWYAREILTFWLGEAFSQSTHITWSILVAGLLLNSYARIPLSVVQGTGRADITAKLHVAELPLFWIALVVLTPKFGIAGAAIAWSLRVGVDAMALSIATRYLAPEAGATVTRGMYISLLLAAIVLFGSFVDDLTLRGAMTLGLCIIYFAMAAKHVCDLVRVIRRRFSSPVSTQVSQG